MKIRDQKTKEAFIKYLEENPEQRFWQAIRNFWKADFVTITKGMDTKDTFYIEADEEHTRL